METIDLQQTDSRDSTDVIEEDIEEKEVEITDNYEILKLEYKILHNNVLHSNVWDKIYGTKELQCKLRRHDMYIAKQYKEAYFITCQHPESKRWRDPLREEVDMYTNSEAMTNHLIHAHRYRCKCSNLCKFEVRIECYSKTNYKILCNSAKHPNNYQLTTNDFKLDYRVLLLIERCAQLPAIYTPTKVYREIIQLRQKLGYSEDHGAFKITSTQLANKMKFIRLKYMTLTSGNIWEGIQEVIDKGKDELKILVPDERKWGVQSLENLCIILFRTGFILDGTFFIIFTKYFSYTSKD